MAVQDTFSSQDINAFNIGILSKRKVRDYDNPIISKGFKGIQDSHIAKRRNIKYREKSFQQKSVA